LSNVEQKLGKKKKSPPRRERGNNFSQRGKNASSKIDKNGIMIVNEDTWEVEERDEKICNQRRRKPASPGGDETWGLLYMRTKGRFR